MNELAEILLINQIFLDVPVTDIKELFISASSNFSISTLLDADLIYSCLQDREVLGSTGLGLGVAIPHGRVKGLKESFCSFYRLSKGIDFNSSDQEPVDIVVFLLVPELATQKHLDLLSDIAQTLADADKRVSLRQIKEPHDILQLLTT